MHVRADSKYTSNRRLWVVGISGIAADLSGINSPKSNWIKRVIGCLNENTAAKQLFFSSVSNSSFTPYRSHQGSTHLFQLFFLMNLQNNYYSKFFFCTTIEMTLLFAYIGFFVWFGYCQWYMCLQFGSRLNARSVKTQVTK